MKRIGWISVDHYNQFLCDGVSRSMSEVLLFLKRLGCEVCIINFLTDTPYCRYVYHHHAANLPILSKEKNRYIYVSDGITIHQEFLPVRPYVDDGADVLKVVIKRLFENKLDYAFTVDRDLLALTAASLMGIPGAHFFHSPGYIANFAEYSSLEFLHKRTIFAVSEFAQSQVKDVLDISATLWYPFIDLDQYRASKSGGRGRVIGFYSAGLHKGEALVNCLISKLASYEFIVVGRNYSHQFDPLPTNLRIWGDVTDIRKFYQQISLLLVPSLGDEGFPRVTLEAAANGIPVIASRVGGIPEALGDSGLLIDWDRSQAPDIAAIAEKYALTIRRILADDELYRRYSHKALTRAREFQSEQKRQSQEIYDKYIRPGQRPVALESN